MIGFISSCEIGQTGTKKSNRTEVSSEGSGMLVGLLNAQPAMPSSPQCALPSIGGQSQAGPLGMRRRLVRANLSLS